MYKLIYIPNNTLGVVKVGEAFIYIRIPQNCHATKTLP